MKDMRFKDILRTISIVAIFGIFAASCDDDSDGIEFHDYSVMINLPEELKLNDASGLKVEFTNVDTGTKTSMTTDAEGKASFTSLQGLFNIEVSGTKTYNYKTEVQQVIFDENDKPKDTITVEQIIPRTVNLAGFKENVPFTTNVNSIPVIDVFAQIPSKGWVIKEFYVTGTKTTAGKNYTKDQFIEIYNNTDTVMYADKISIGETLFTTSSGKSNFFGKDVDDKAFLQTVYTIEGTGKEHPVEPGKSIVIAPQPIDHTSENSLNLAKPISDFQWYDAHATLSIQVPEVPDLVRYYSYSKTIWQVTMQMNRGFVIFKVPDNIEMDDFINKYTDIRFNNAGKNTTSIGVPNEYVLDAIELGDKEHFTYKSLAASLDIGFSYTKDTANGKSIRRKIDRVETDGRVVYKDTNNSTNDFWVGKTPQPKKYPTNDEKDN